MTDARLPVPIRWVEDRRSVVVLDQTELPEREVERELRTIRDVDEAIRSLRVRGAPLIGITAAMGVAAAAVSEADADPELPPSRLADRVAEWAETLEGARPTAVNLAWALSRIVSRAADADAPDARSLAASLVDEADRIRDEDRAMCRRIGEAALSLIEGADRLLTHCNAGALATGGVGTALAPIHLAAERGSRPSVFVGETRPLLQGSRLTAWELARAGVEVTVLADGAGGALFADDPPDAVLVGADRIAANGDVANKVGTYGLAVLAHHHGVPFYVLAPTSTVDLATPSGREIPIEYRSDEELRRGFGRTTVAPSAGVWTPAFDVTPAGMITAIVTERGVHRPPFPAALARAVRRSRPEAAVTPTPDTASGEAATAPARTATPGTDGGDAPEGGGDRGPEGGALRHPEGGPEGETGADGAERA